MKQELIDISLIEANDGQIKDVPSNPRSISAEKVEALKRSIQNLPDMLSMRELLVYPLNGKYIVLGGNMRYRACLTLGYNEIPCKVIPASTPPEKLRAIVMQDNNSYGETDWEMIAKEWDLGELRDWNIDLPKEWSLSPDDFGDSFSLPDGNKKPFQQMTFTFADEQAQIIRQGIDSIKTTDSYKYAETFGNENANGNALSLIVKQWVEQKK